MTQKPIADLKLDELVRRFEEITLAQDEAINNDDNSKYNRLFKEMDLLRVELKRRDGDQRRLLLALLEHANAQVRLMAAIATLANDRQGALKAFKYISDNNEYPQAADARGMMSAVAEGRYQPT